MNVQPLIEHIERIVPLTQEEQDILLTHITYRKMLKGQFLVQQGDICRYSGFVISGCTKTFYVDDEGQEHVIMFSIEDWWTSDIGSFITQSPADFNVQCLENTELILFPYEKQEALFEAIPKMERFFRKIIEKAFAASQKRIVRNFTMSARDRYLFFRSQYPKMEQRIPQYLIASYLGITKEFLSKIKNQIATEE